MPNFHRVAVLLSAILLAPSVSVRTLRAQSTAVQQEAPLGSPDNSEPEIASPREGNWTRTVKADLIAGRFDDLDRMADQYRREKTLLPGGAWRLHRFYEVLDAPHMTDQDFAEHLDHLRDWMRLRPESITARVALATSLMRWAWVARGNGLARTVTDEGWQLFTQRSNEALVVLQGSEQLHTLCPQWYSEMMQVGLALGWDQRRMEKLFDRAIQFEPNYPTFYVKRANYLLPKWYGKEGDATTFARTSADRVGGDNGDRIYFQIATVIIKRGNGNLAPFVQAMDWERIQRGYRVLGTQAGTSRGSENELAFMAYKFHDVTIAHQQFALIGPDWSHGVWKDENFFNKVRDWSTGHQNWP